MKFDLNHIDDIFKDGLEDYSEQPSPGSWKKISSRMLWDDIIHLRFGNLPKVWIGTAAGVAILAVVVSLWLTSGVGETEPSALDTEEVITTPEQNQEQAGMDETPSIQPQQNVSIVTTEPEKAETVSATSFPDEISSDGDAGDPLVADEPERQMTITAQTGHDPSDPDRLAAIDGESAQATAVDPSSSKIITLQQTTSVQNTAETTEDIKSVLDKDTNGESSGTAATLAAGATAASQSASISSDLPSGQESQIDRPVRSGIDAGESKFSEAGQPANLNGNRSALPPQKMPEIDVLSFAASQPMSGYRQPSLRNSGNMAGLLYGGYKPYFSVSAYFAPEVTEYYRPASESMENSWIAGVAVSYNTENYIIQAGLEYSVFDDMGDYMVNINSYDSIGFYEGISGFEIDPENPGELIYHTHTVEVYDTVQHHSHQQTRNNYAYLQVPVMFGYKAMESGIFSAHIKAGPSFSFLLNRDEPRLDFQTGPGARITSVDNFTASRLNTNIQVLVSLALRLQLSERVGILVEPTYRHYLNSIYNVDDKTLKNPYGIGVRGGIFFNLK